MLKKHNKCFITDVDLHIKHIHKLIMSVLFDVELECEVCVIVYESLLVTYV